MRSDIPLQQILNECGGPFREYLFSNEALSSDECYRLALHAERLVFDECIFLDSGAAFRRGVQERVTPLSVTFLGRDPPFLGLCPVELRELELGEGFPLSKADCESLANAKIECLTLEKCRLEDHGGSLFSAIASAKGPRHLRLSHWDDPEQLDEWLIAAISSEQCQLQSISLVDVSEQSPTLSSWRSIMQAILVVSTSLTCLELDSVRLTAELWDIFLDFLDQSKTVSRLSFQNICDGHSNHHCGIAHRLAEIVKKNTNIEEISGRPFNKDIWDTQIVPRVLDNRYRNRFRKLQRDQSGVAILAHALAQPELQQENISYLYVLLESSVNLLTANVTKQCL